jgi:hypothetical protein
MIDSQGNEITGGSYMQKDNLHLKRKANEEILEISSTGYGLVSVTEENAEEHTIQNEKNNNPNCGGL